MIEPSSGRPRTSGPGASLLIGIGASAGLLIAFLFGFQLGRGQDTVRTVVIGSIVPSQGTERPLSAAAAGGFIQQPQVDDQLQQAYYTHLGLGSWVVCAQHPRPSLTCVSIQPVPLDGRRAFDAPSTHWADVHVARLEKGARVYLIGNLEHVWLGDVRAGAGFYDRLLGVTLNGSVQYFDLGDLAPGRYVLLDRSENAFTERGPVSKAAGLAVVGPP